MRRILTEPGVAKFRRFGLGIVLNWEMLLAELIKVWVVEEKNTRAILGKRKKKKKNALKLLRKFYYKPGLIYGTID